MGWGGGVRPRLRPREHAHLLRYQRALPAVLFPAAWAPSDTDRLLRRQFPELWHEAHALGTDLVVWPSAMNSSSDPSAPSYARLHQYHVAGVGSPGNVFAPTGGFVPTVVPDSSLPLLKIATVDLDAQWAHWDNNRAKVHKLLAENEGVELAVPGPPFYYLRATRPDVSVRCERPSSPALHPRGPGLKGLPRAGSSSASTRWRRRATTSCARASGSTASGPRGAALSRATGTRSAACEVGFVAMRGTCFVRRHVMAAWLKSCPPLQTENVARSSTL